MAVSGMEACQKNQWTAYLSSVEGVFGVAGNHAHFTLEASVYTILAPDCGGPIFTDVTLYRLMLIQSLVTSDKT